MGRKKKEATDSIQNVQNVQETVQVDKVEEEDTDLVRQLKSKIMVLELEIEELKKKKNEIQNPMTGQSNRGGLV